MLLVRVQLLSLCFLVRFSFNHFINSLPVKCSENDSDDINELFEIGNSYENHNNSEAIKCYLFAAKKGHKEAQIRLFELFNMEDQFGQAEYFEWVKHNGLADTQYYIGKYYASTKADTALAVKYYKRAADQNHASALYELSYHTQSLASVLEYLRKAANLGHLESLFELGHLLSDEKSSRANFSEAVDVLIKAADQNHADAQNLLGYIHERGLAGEVDESKALKYYEMAADGGVARAQYNLGVFHDEGKGIPEDKAKAFQYYMKAADQGIADAQFYVGYFYEVGFAVEANLTMALKYYELAAEGGYAKARYNAGVYHENGLGHTPVDKAKAFRYYKMAADKGVADAQYIVGYSYEQGISVAANSSLALKYFRLAADNSDINVLNFGHPDIPAKNNEAQYKVGRAYELGTVVQKDFLLALKYYQLAADGGITDAQYVVGQFYYEGRGCPVDNVKALHYYLMAADQGHTLSQCQAGYLLYNGIGVDVDQPHALKLYEEAASTGSSRCKSLLDDHNSIITLNVKQQSALHRLLDYYSISATTSTISVAENSKCLWLWYVFGISVALSIVCWVRFLTIPIGNDYQIVGDEVPNALFDGNRQPVLHVVERLADLEAPPPRNYLGEAEYVVFSEDSFHTGWSDAPNYSSGDERGFDTQTVTAAPEVLALPVLQTIQSAQAVFPEVESLRMREVVRCVHYADEAGHISVDSGMITTSDVSVTSNDELLKL